MATSTPLNDNVAHALAGAGGGILSMLLTYPLITLSTRAQVESRRARAPFLETVQRIVAREGVGGLYSGLASALLGISLTNFVYYYWYEWTRAALVARARRGRARLAIFEAMFAGAVAGAATVVVTNPIWVVNTRLTTRRHAAPSPDDTTDHPPTTSVGGGTLGTLVAMLRHEGPQSLFSGVLPALVLVVNPILQYSLFEQLRNAIARRRKVTPTVAFFLGAVSKLFATAITYPYITVKSQMHVARVRDKAGNEGMWASIRRITSDEGYAGLYKGIGPKLIQSVLTAAFLFAFKDVLYEQIVKLKMRSAKRPIVK